MYLGEESEAAKSSTDLLTCRILRVLFVAFFFFSLHFFFDQFFKKTHFFAQDTQTYDPRRHENSYIVKQLVQCIDEIKVWM